ncbi:hypothetical protein ABK040_002523 [Willaertia magna]
METSPTTIDNNNKEEEEKLNYLFQKVDNVSQLIDSISLIITYNKSTFDSDKYYGQYLIPMDDNCVYYMDDEGDKQMVVVSIKNEYKELINLRRIKFIHSELECTFIVMDDTVWVAGNNSNYQLGLGHNNPLTQIPTKITTTLPQTEKIKKISILQHSTIFLMESGNVYVCGRDYYNDYKSNSEQNKHNFKVPTLILQNILNISFDTQFYVLFENHFNELLVSGVVTNDIIGLKLKDLSHLYNTKPIYFPGLKSLKSPRVNISNNNSSTSTNSNNSNGSSNGHLSTSVTSLKLNQSKLKISCNLRSIMILSMNTNTIYVYGENSNGKFGINTKDDIFGELYINEFFKNYKVTITDIQNSDTCCYFLSNENQVYLSGNGSLIPVKILHSHFVTKLLPNNLFIADRGKYINRDGEITLRYVYKYYSENFFLMDHFDFIVEGKIVTVFKSALYPMDKFSKVKLLDETFLHHLISDKKITFKKLSDFFYSQSMLDLVNGEYDLKNLEFYFKASFDAYNANELQLQKARLDKFVKSQHIYNTDILTLVVKKMKEFMDMYHVNITTNMDFLFVYLYAVGFFQHSMKEDFLLFEMLEIAFNNNLTIFIEPFILYLEDNLLHTTEINVNNLQFEIPKNYEELKNILMSSCFESSSNNNANNNTNSLNLSNNNHNSTSINGTRRGSNASDILSSIRHNRYSDVGEVAPVSSFLSFDSSVLTTNTPNNHSPQTSPSQPQKLFDKLFSNNKSPTTIGAIPPLIIAFVFSFSLLAAAKLLLKCDRVKNADSKISKDETIVLQTVMEDMKIMIEEDLKKQEFIAAMQKRKKKDFQPLIKFANEKMWNYGKEIIKNLPNFTKGNEVCILFKYLTLNVLQQEPKWLKEITKHTFCNGKYVVLKRIAGGAEGNIYLCIVDKKVLVVDNNNNNNATTSTTTTSTALPSFNNNGGSSTSSLVRIGNNINNVVNYSQMVAVKKLTENLDKESVEVLKWQIEQVTSMSNHPNICPYIDYQIDEKGDGEYSATMVMPYFELGTLYSKVLEYKQKNLKIQNWLDLALQISNGLQQLHYKNLIFRDLKSDNILLEKSEDGKEICKIADFGLMKSHDLYDTDFSVKGTPSTLAPECTDGSFRIEKASDIFSLGCVIFELITLENQIVKNNTQSKLQTKFLMHEAVKTDEQGTQIILCKMMKKNQIPELIQRLVISMIQYHPLKRPSIDSVIDVLRTVQSGNSKLIEECTVRYDQVLLPLITKVKKQSKKVANFLKKFNESFIANGRFRIEETKTLNNLTSYKCTDLENRDLVIIRCCKFLSDFTLQIAKYQTYKHIYLASIYDQFIWNENYYYSILYKPTLFDLINTKLQNKSFFTEIEIVKIGTQLIELIYFLQKRQLLHKHLTISTIMTNKLSENCNDFDITVTDLEYLKDVQENLREEYYEKKKFILTDELQEEIIQEWFQKDIKTIGIILCQCMTLNINPLLTSFTNSNNNNNEELTTLLRKYNNYSDKLIQFILKLSTTTSLPSHIVQLKTEFNLYSQQLGIQFPSPFHITTTKSPRRRTLEILNELQLQE